jgi:hypothetical protein
MLKRWFFASAVSVVVAISVLPAHAQPPAQTVIDQGRNVYLVDGTRGSINNLLPSGQVDRIATLQFGRFAAYPVSPVSPDDQVVFVGAGSSYAVLDLQGQSLAVVAPDVLASFFGTDQFLWLGNDTLAQVGYAVDENGFVPALLQIDRTTGAADIQPLALPVGLSLVSLSPDGGKLLLIGDAAVETLAERQLPTGLRTSRLPQWRQDQLAALRRAHPGLARHTTLAALFDPSPYELQVVLNATQILVYDLASATLRELLTLPASTRVSGMAWAPDGSRLAISHTAFVANDRPRYDGARISEEIYRDVTGNLAPANNPLFQRSALDTFELNKSEAQRRRAVDGDGTVFGDVSWSSDGATLMVQHLAPGRLAGRRYPIYNPQFLERGSFRFYDKSMRELRRLDAPALASIDSTLTYGRFVSPDEVIFSAHAGTTTQPSYYNLRSGEFRQIGTLPGTYANIIATSSRTRQLVFFYDSFTEPGELYRMGWDGNGMTALTDFNTEVRAQSTTRQHAVSFTLANGQVRQGVLILPADAPFPPKQQPMVVWQEGGPTSSMQNTWSATVESPFALLPNFGIGVLVTPLYGRYGLGAERFNGLSAQANFGQIDIDEQAAIVRQIIAKGWAKPGQVGIAGCSYGGYFVTQSLTRHPDLYGAGHAMCSLVDSVTEWNRGFDSLMPWLQGLPPFANLEEYRRDSPLYNAGQVRTPLLSFHGTEDFLPITQMENFHLQVINREVPAKLLKFAAVGHGFGATPDGLEELYFAYELYGAQEQIGWFQTYLR